MIEIPLINTPATAAEWPDLAVVDAALADPSWRPLPFTQFVVKVHGRCNLACDYCYIYEMADQSWRANPMAMARETVDRTAYRITEHLTAHRDELSQVIVTFLGGEALLVGADELDYAATAFRAAMQAGIEAILSVTTNGVLLDDPRMLAVLEKHDIKVTLSLDGARDAHDRHARMRTARAVSTRSCGAWRRCARWRPSRTGCGTCCAWSTSRTTHWRRTRRSRRSAPRWWTSCCRWTTGSAPPGWTGDKGGTTYADWLIPIFERWYRTVPMPTSVRFFDSIIGLVLGGHSTTEAVGLEDFQSLTIDTDGSIELIDALKSTFQDAPLTGLDVFGNAFDEARLHPGVVARQRGVAGLSPTCRSCSLRDICGGGQYTNRYRAGTGFLNPTVYCTDQAKLITHIRDQVLADVERLRAGAPLDVHS